MRVSRLFGRTLRAAPAEAEHAGHQLVLRAGLARQIQAGSFALLPLGMAALRRIEAIMHEELAAIDGQEFRTPIVQAATSWQRSGRYADYGPLMLRAEDRSGRALVIAPTHEEAVAELAAHEITSYRQLPQIIYQIHTKYRDEGRAKGGLMRLREFTMLDAYSLGADTASLDQAYEALAGAFTRIFARCGLDVVAVEASAGEMGGGEPREYMALSASGEDTLVLCDACGYAANSEVAERTASDGCVRCNAPLRLARGVEIGHIFKLGTRFSQALGANYLGVDGAEHPIVMGSYGIGLERMLQIIVEQHADAQGIAWPQAVAPLDVQLLRLGQGEDVRAAAEAAYADLCSAGLRVLYDDREETAGVKFNDADLLGLPLRVVISERLLKLGQVELKRRGGAAHTVAREQLVAAALQPT
ncbi:MAG: proline--tRNA ligase [Roseiflexaceae bacterium]|nr:proline--tRNA ligase [Roseiflexaceae bacterium]